MFLGLEFVDPSGGVDAAPGRRGVRRPPEERGLRARRSALSRPRHRRRVCGARLLLAPPLIAEVGELEKMTQGVRAAIASAVAEWDVDVGTLTSDERRGGTRGVLTAPW